MVERKWMPHQYQDEVVPPARATPSAWITKMSDGAAALAAGEQFSDDDEPGEVLHDGQRVLFDWVESYGQRDLTWHTDDDSPWTWTLNECEPTCSPGGEMLVAEAGDWETMMPSLVEFATEYGDKVSGETITITFYAWSSHPTEFEFRAGAFHEVTSAAAPVVIDPNPEPSK